MRLHSPRRLVLIAPLVVSLALLAACSSSASTTAGAQPTATSSPTSLPAATNTPVPTATAIATAAPQPGVCNAADFPTKTSGGPNEGFTYPPLTYYYDIGPAAGNHYFVLCSSGSPTSIKAFLLDSIPHGGWTVTDSTGNTIDAQQPTTPPSGFCSSVDITLGESASYPGEWKADFHPPISSC